MEGIFRGVDHEIRERERESRVLVWRAVLLNPFGTLNYQPLG